MDSFQKLDRIEREARARSEGDDQLNALAEFCGEAKYLEGSLYQFAVRSALAELADSWLDSLPSSDTSMKKMMNRDLSRVIDEAREKVVMSLDGEGKSARS